MSDDVISLNRSFFFFPNCDTLLITGIELLETILMKRKSITFQIY